MRLIGTALVIGAVIVAVQSPSIIGDIKDATVNAFSDGTPDATQTTSADDQKTYDRLCPLLNVWSDMDTNGRAATTHTIKRMARKEASQTEDPALRAFLKVVPDALGTGSTLQTKAAKALIDRECSAHSN